MTRTKQSASLARKVADRWLDKGMTEHDFYYRVLGRDSGSRILPSDRALWHQTEYALEHLTPLDLERMANELLAATGGR